MRTKDVIMLAGIKIMAFVLLLACGGDEDDKSDLELAQEYCTTVCKNAPTSCPEVAEDLPAGLSDCVAKCTQGDEPEGQTQELAYLECISKAQSCDDYVSCKSQ